MPVTRAASADRKVANIVSLAREARRVANKLKQYHQTERLVDSEQTLQNSCHLLSYHFLQVWNETEMTVHSPANLAQHSGQTES